MTAVSTETSRPGYSSIVYKWGFVVKIGLTTQFLDYSPLHVWRKKTLFFFTTDLLPNAGKPCLM
jgi:hypothetical protein